MILRKSINTKAHLSPMTIMDLSPIDNTHGEFCDPDFIEMYRYKILNDLNSAVFNQNHLYGIDCKISGAIDLLSEVKGREKIQGYGAMCRNIIRCADRGQYKFNRSSIQTGRYRKAIDRLGRIDVQCRD